MGLTKMNCCKHYYQPRLMKYPRCSEPERGSNYCEHNPNCYYKQLKTITAERDRYKTALKFVQDKIGLFMCITPDDVLTNIRKSKRKIVQINNKIKQALEEG